MMYLSFKNPCLDASGAVAYAVCVAHDVTELHRMQEELVRARDEAERTARMKATFLADMSHEIRTPLNVILGYSQIMDRECVACPQKANIRSIRESGEHLLDLINDILAGSERDSRSVPLTESAFDVIQTVESVLALFRNHPDAAGLRLEVTIASDVPRHIFADKGKVRQVLLNLIGNAVKFTERGFVRLDVRRVPPPASFLPSPELGNDVRHIAVLVEDSGCGVPEDQLDSIFEAFVKRDNPRAKRSGSGIGLALSRRFAQALGGELTVTSRVGEGSAFRFTFEARVVPEPLAVGGPEGPSLQACADGGELPRVLVVDDNRAGREMQCAMLRTAGFATDTAECGEQALERLARGERYRLILLDKCMPGIDGLETLKRLRATEEGREVPVLLFTASGYSDEAAVLALRGNGILHKPVRMAQLLETVRSVAGVAFETASGADPTHSAPAAGAADACELSDELRARLIEAARRGDIRLLKALARELAKSSPLAAAALAPLIEAYAYDQLVSLLERSPA